MSCGYAAFETGDVRRLDLCQQELRDVTCIPPSCSSRTTFLKLKHSSITFEHANDSLSRHALHAAPLHCLLSGKHLRTEHRWCLTGTPLQNRPADIGALFAFLRLQPVAEATVFRRSIRHVKLLCVCLCCSCADVRFWVNCLACHACVA
jgi:SNF2-related domain